VCRAQHVLLVALPQGQATLTITSSCSLCTAIVSQGAPRAAAVVTVPNRGFLTRDARAPALKLGEAASALLLLLVLLVLLLVLLERLGAT